MREERIFYTKVRTRDLHESFSDCVAWVGIDDDEAVIRVIGRRDHPDAEFRPVSAQVIE